MVTNIRYMIRFKIKGDGGYKGPRMSVLHLIDLIQRQTCTCIAVQK